MRERDRVCTRHVNGIRVLVRWAVGAKRNELFKDLLNAKGVAYNIWVSAVRLVFNPALCCSVLQCVVVCCSVLQCVVVCCSVLQCVVVCCSVLQCVVLCCIVLQCVVVCCSVLQCVAVCCRVMQCV